MKEEGEGKQLVECMICGVLVGSVYSYHKHNVRQHSLAQLSRAILKLRNLKLPLADPAAEGDDDDYDDDDVMCGGRMNPLDVLQLPVKVEAMDEVIELGPTDNSDHLQIQSRLLNSTDEVSQQSRQVIEVKENKNNPPPYHFYPSAEDPNAISVKFNKELITAKDNSCPTVTLPDRRRTRAGSKVLRATFKSTIEIPSPNSFITDYRKAMSHPSEKYIMQNIDRSASPPQKKRKGRPRKLDTPIPIEAKSSAAKRKGELPWSDGDEENDGILPGDPPLFSDDDGEEDQPAAILNVSKTRSGRTVKTKKEDETFRYYDTPGSSQLDGEDMKGQKQRGDKAYLVRKNRRGKKRKILSVPSQKSSTSSDNASSNTSSFVKGHCRTNAAKKDILHSSVVTNNGSIESVENRKENKGDNMASHSNSRNKMNVNSDATGPGGVTDFVCFMCFKEFATKEECEKHMQEHLGAVTSMNGEATGDNENQDQSDVDATEIVNVPAEDLDPLAPDDTVEKTPVSPSTVGDSAKKGQDSLTCNVCKNVFDTQDALDGHSHDAVHDCKICGKKYQNRVNLQSHIKKYHEETEWMKFRCATCGKSFGFLLALERHMKEHNPTQKFCCEHCGKVFKTLTNLKNHFPLHTKDEIFRCPYCPKEYYIRYSYEKHVKTHLYPPKFHCDVCNKYFNDKKYFEVHLERHQNGGCLGRSKDFRCNNCGDIKTPTELEIVSETDPGHHKTCLMCGRGHYKKFMLENIEPLSAQDKVEKAREQCKLCGKFVINIMRHFKSTHLENPYIPCDVCGVVVSKSSLPSHKNRKHGGSAVTCDHCYKVFKNIMCLREHMAKVRKKGDPSRNKCKFCKELVSPELWKEHMAMHRMKCNECGASVFGGHDELAVHLEACRRCSNCGTSGFASQEEYLAHMEMCGSSIDIMAGTLDAASDQEVVTSIFAIVDDSTCCGTCGEDFEDQIALANHITEAHPDTVPADSSLRETGMNGEDVLYACPQGTCGDIFTSKESLSNHLTTVHNS